MLVYFYFFRHNYHGRGTDFDFFVAVFDKERACFAAHVRYAEAALFVAAKVLDFFAVEDEFMLIELHIFAGVSYA